MNLDKITSGEKFGGNLEVMGSCPVLDDAGTLRTFSSKHIGIVFNCSKYKSDIHHKWLRFSQEYNKSKRKDFNEAMK